MTGPEINGVLAKCVDLYRTGEVYMEPGFASKYGEAMAELTKEIEKCDGVAEALRYVLTDVLAVSLSDVGVDIGLDGNTLSKYVTGARNPSVGVVIAICLDVHLPPQITHAVLKKTHYNFVAGNRRDSAYLAVVDHFWMHGDIVEINALLKAQGVKLLTRKLSHRDR